MPPKPKTATPDADVKAALDWLKKHANKSFRNDMGPRYGIHTEQAYGVKMADMQKLAKQLGTNHALAEALWQTGWYDARMVASMIDDPALVTPAQMDRWAKDFDNWGICDTVCFKLFDRTPHAWKKIDQWSAKRAEFVRRGGFALLASVALHDKAAPDQLFLERFSLIEAAADDDRNFVKKGVSWALRAIGHRNAKLRAAAIELAQRMATSEDTTTRWIGKDVLRDLKRK